MTPKFAFIAAAACLALAPAAFAQPPAAAPAAAPAKAKFSVSATPLVDLLKNAPAKAVLVKHLPEVIPQVEGAIDMIPPDFTLEALAEFTQGAITPAVLKAIDADLAKL